MRDRIKKPKQMTIRKKLLAEVDKLMDIKDMSEVARDWRLAKAVFYLLQVEEEEKQKAAKSNGQH